MRYGTYNYNHTNGGHGVQCHERGNTGVLHELAHSKTDCPTSRLWGQILRNGKPVTDSDIEPVKDNTLGETIYGVVLLRGAKEIGTIEM